MPLPLRRWVAGGALAAAFLTAAAAALRRRRPAPATGTWQPLDG